MDNTNKVLVQINNTKLAFNKLLSVNNNICSLLDTLNDTRNLLKQEYVDIVNKYNKSDYSFGLDTFNFQTKLIDNDYQNIKKNYSLITNRIYFDYFKLIKMIVDVVTFKDSIKNNKVQNPKQKYDYLDIYKPYSIDVIKDIFIYIISIIEESYHYLTEECKSHSNYELKLEDGININNFVTYYDFKNKSNLQNILLYINYLNFFIKLHNKYLNKVYFRLNLIYQQLNCEVKIDKFNTKKHNKEDIIRDINELQNTQLSKYAYDSTYSTNSNKLEDTEYFDAEKDEKYLIHCSESLTPQINIEPNNNNILDDIDNSEENKNLVVDNDSNITFN